MRPIVLYVVLSLIMLNLCASSTQVDIPSVRLLYPLVLPLLLIAAKATKHLRE